MTVLRGLFGVLAVGTATLAGLVLLTGTTLPVEALVTALGNDYLVLVLVAGIAVVGAATVSARRSIGGIDQATPPDTEDVHVVPTLGSDLDDYLSTPFGVGASEPRGMQSRLFRLAVTIAMHEDNCQRPEALHRVENGTWTSDPYAAAYLASDGTSLTTGQRLRAMLAGDSATQHGVRRAATEIVRRGAGVTSS